MVLIFLFNGVIQTISVAFSLKTSRACTDMLSNQNDAVKFSKKNCERHKQHVHHVHHGSSTRGTGTFLHISLPSTGNMNAKVAVELYYIFSKMSIF